MPARYLKPVICLFLIIATVAVFGQVKDHEFLNYDDHVYVTENFIIHGGLTAGGVHWAFTTTHGDNWHPVTWLSHMLDCQLYGLNPGGHHLTNVLLHVANTLLLFFLLSQITAKVWPSAMVAALFALHPLHVESVAWVSERKDVLSAFFFLTTLWAYAWYAAQPSLRRYLLVFFSFVLGLMAKPMLVTLPFVLLLLDYWPLGRFAPASPITGKRRKKDRTASLLYKEQALRLVWEKAPLFALTAAACVITMVAQRKGIVSLDLTPLSRIGNALVAYVLYLGKMLWPLHLAAFYPHPGNSLPWWQGGAAALVLFSVTFLVLKKGQAHPYLPVGWFWYLGTLVPVIGLVQVGEQSLADRYTYLPLIGIFIILAWGAADLTAAWRRQKAALALGAGLLLSLLLALTWVQASYWRNTLLLFKHAAQVTENNYLAYCNVGAAYLKQGMFDEALVVLQKAEKIRPRYADTYYNMGNVYAEKGMSDEAIAMFQKAIQIKPDFADAYNNMGIDLAHRGQTEEALAALKKAIELKPDYSEAYCNLGIVYAQQGKIDEALDMWQNSLRINPKNEGARKMLKLGRENARK